MGSLSQATVPPFETTLGDLLIERARSDPDHVVFVDGERRVTIADLADRVRAMAAALAARGIGPGDPVLAMLGNDTDHISLFLGLSMVGALWVPIGPQARGVALAHAIAVTKPVLAFAPADAERTLREAKLDDACPILDVGRWAAALPAATADREFAPVKPDDVRAIVFTSGTSGPPKGVMVSERMVIAAAAGTALASACHDGDVFIMWEPLHHIGGSQIVAMALIHRITLVVVERFSASRLWGQVRRHGVTKLHYLGGVLDILLKADARPDDRHHPVELAFGGGCRPETWRAFEGRFGIPIREVYGMTEASSFTTINRNGVTGSVGTPVPWFDVDLLDDGGGPVADGDIGEIIVTAAHPGLVTRGYLNAPDATARLLKGGCLHTGDLGRRDANGNLWFVGRVTDSLRRRGENVSAWEVETALAGHDAIAECAVVGVPAAIGEHDILCFVVMGNGHAFAPAALAEWCRTVMPPHHVPRYWKQVGTFDRTPSQRIRKDRLDTSLDTATDTTGDAHHVRRSG